MYKCKKKKNEWSLFFGWEKDCNKVQKKGVFGPYNDGAQWRTLSTRCLVQFTYTDLEVSLYRCRLGCGISNDYGLWKTPQTGVKHIRKPWMEAMVGVKYKYCNKTPRRWVNATRDGRYGGRYIECALCEFPVAVLLPLVEYSCVYYTL